MRICTSLPTLLGAFCLFVLAQSPTYGGDPTPSPKPKRPPSGKVFRLRLAFEPATLDWTLGDIPIWVIQNTMRGLYRVNAQGQVESDLVDSAQVSDGDKRWVFTLRQGVRWSDGVPLNAGHATEALRRLFDPKTGSSYGYFLNDIDGADSVKPEKLGIKTLGETQFEIRLKHPTPYLPAILSHWVTYPVRPDLIARHKDYGANPRHMAFLGAYTVDEWQHGLRLLLKPHPHALVPAFFSRVEAWVIPDEQTALRLFDIGHLELLAEPPLLSPAETQRLAASIQDRPSPIAYFVGVHPSHPLTRTREGILALSSSLARDEIPKLLGVPHRVAQGFCPPEILDGLSPPVSGEAATRTPSEWLKRAGFTEGQKIPSIRLAYFEKTAMRELAQWLQAQWKAKLGVQVELDGLEPKTYWRYLAKQPAPLFLNSKGASYPDADAFFSLFLSTNPQNLGRWRSPEYDKHVLAAGQETNASKRRDLYNAATRELIFDQPGMIPLYLRTTRYLVQPYVQDLRINFLTSVDFSQARY